MSDALKVFCGACVCISVTTLILLVVFSFRILDVNEYGLNYSTITKTI